MATKLEDRHEFDKPWSTVQKMFSDPAYFVKKYEMLRNTNVNTLEQEKKGDQFRIKVQYEQKPSIQIPSFAQKFIASTILVTQEDSWDLKTGKGRLTIELKNMPMKISADMKITDQAGGCVNVLNWTLSSPIPLIGGKLEKLLAEDIEKKAVADLAASRTLLKNY